MVAPDGAKAYVSSWADNTVSVLDLVNDAVLGTIPISNPTALAVTPDGNDVYVTSASPDQVTRIDTATDAVVGTPIALSSGGRGIAVAPNGTRAYVVRDGGSVSEIFLSTQALSGTHFTVGGIPMAIAAAPDGKHLLVANYNDYVSVIDVWSVFDVIATVNTDGGRGVAISPARHAHADDSRRGARGRPVALE